MNLKDKVIVITGGTGGIGKDLALRFKNEGATVITSSNIEEKVSEMSQDFGIDSFVVDVRNESEVQEFAKTVFEKFGHIDMWVNNAGVFHSFSSEDKFVDMEEARKIIDTNLFGSIFGTRSVLPYMRKQGVGSVVQILSTAALDATRAKNAKIYAASKWAVRGYMQAIEAQNAEYGVSFYSVYPGGTKTSLYNSDKTLPGNYEEYMESDYVAEKIVINLLKENPEKELIIRRPSA